MEVRETSRLNVAPPRVGPCPVGSSALPRRRTDHTFAIVPGRVLIGTSGFLYRHWRNGVFYPPGLPQREELEFFATQFRTVELNSPFYRLPPRTTFVRWKERTPADFRYAVKASRYVTHVRRLEACEEPVRTFLRHARALGKKLGPVLFQLPPSMEVDLARLQAFVRLLPLRGRFAIEVRHSTWLQHAVYKVLERRSLACCTPVGGRLTVNDVIVTAPFAYLRMHAGRGRDGNFTGRQLDTWARRVDALSTSGIDVYVYFNNDWRGYAVRNARTLRQLLGLER